MENATYEVTTYLRSTEGKDYPTAGAHVRIRAPVADVLAEALRFKRYWELISPYLESSNVVAKEGDATDVYVRGPSILHMWAVLRFKPVEANGGLSSPDAPTGRTPYAYKGTYVDGNLDDLTIAWRLVPAGPSETIAEIEMFADPPFIVPRKFLSRFSRNGVCIMLARLRSHVEQPEFDATTLNENLPCVTDTSP
jgi:hypothetical protein